MTRCCSTAAAWSEHSRCCIGSAWPGTREPSTWTSSCLPRRRCWFADRLSALIEGAGTEGGLADPMPETVIPVRYDGLDLAEVAEIAGMSAEQVVERHLAARYTVAFTGFAPGFAYLSGGDPALVVPRRSTPRPRIDAGSVGLAGPFSAVYPRQSPGGWQLIGRTASSMWDLDRDPPALLLPGNRVRFVPEREAVKRPRPGPARPEGPAPLGPWRWRSSIPGCRPSSRIADAPASRRWA